ncbi:MAG TPA: PepSY domain-containing protein [Methylovirgula sp.]|nr:PepSY domain-containing protein [Methylovirgula sp.]
MILLVNAPAVAAERAIDHVAEHAGQRATEHAAQHGTEHPASEHAASEHAASEHVCLTAAQAREIVAAHRLAEPFRVMQTTARHFQAEALRAKLCRRKDELIYEITLLRRDGRVIHVSLNAVSGKIVRTVNAK